MILIVAYDITDNKIRKKLANYLAYEGLVRVQKSVFMGPSDYLGKSRIKAEIRKKIADTEQAQIFVHTIDSRSVHKGNFIGDADDEMIQDILNIRKFIIY